MLYQSYEPHWNTDKRLINVQWWKLRRTHLLFEFAIFQMNDGFQPNSKDTFVVMGFDTFGR